MEHNLTWIVVNVVVTLVAVTTLMWRLASARDERLMKQLSERFDAESKSRADNDKHIRELLSGAQQNNQRLEQQITDTHRELLELKADIPEKYVRREDYIRGQTIVESKLDALALQLQNWQLKGDRHA